MNNDIEVTVLLPCLNEAETLGSCVRKAKESLAALGVSGEVLVSDNGSTDGSQVIAVSAGARVVNAPIRGYGGALLHGIAHARGRYIIMADADDSYDLSNLSAFIDGLRAGHDVVMGNRFRGGIAVGAMPPLHRYLGNPVLSWLGRVLFRLRGIGDFHCGIRGFNRDRIRALQLCMPGMEFASELVVRAALAAYSIVEVPTTLQPDGRSRSPHLRTWRDGWRHLRFLVIFAPRKTVFWPGLVFLALGLVGLVALVPGPVTLGSVQFDINTLAYSCMSVIVGTQLVLFGGMAEIYGRHEGIVRESQLGRWVKLLKLEHCAFVGIILVLTGLTGSLAAVGVWGESGFGDLDPRGPIRIVLASSTAVALGVIVIFAGIVTSLLTLRGVSQSASALPVQPAVRSESLSGTTHG